MAHFQQHGHEQASRVDEYGNPVPGGILGQTGGIGRHHDARGAGGYGRQAGYGPTGTGVHDTAGYGGSGQPAYGATGAGIHDAGGVGGYGPTGAGPHATAGLTGAGHTGAMHGTHGAGGLGTGGHTGGGVLGGMGTHGARGTDHTGLLGATGIHGPGHTGGMHGGAATGLGTGIAATHGAEHKAGGGILRRSGSSSSSSSSEDDGMGGRRKKGIKEKIKEKLPGGRKDQTAATGGYAQDSAYTGTGGYAQQGAGEKKGMVEKIKEKLPGGGHKDEYGAGQQHTTATGGYAPGRTGTTDTYGAEGTHEKKGIMEKIKEKLPGSH